MNHFLNQYLTTCLKRFLSLYLTVRLKQLCCLQYPYFVNSYQTAAHLMYLYLTYPVVSVQSDLLYCPKLFHQAGFHQSCHRPVYPAVSARSVYLKHCQKHFRRNHLRLLNFHLMYLHSLYLHPLHLHSLHLRSFYLRSFCLHLVYLHLVLLHLVQLHPVRHLPYCHPCHRPACHCLFLWYFQRHRLQLYQSLHHQFVPHMMHLCRHLYSQL